MKIRISPNLDLVLHRSVLRKPIDALKEATGHPVAPRNRSAWESVRLFDVRRHAQVPPARPPVAPIPQVTIPVGEATFDADALATEIADDAFSKVAAIPDRELLPAAPPVQTPTVFITYAGPSNTTPSTPSPVPESPTGQLTPTREARVSESSDESPTRSNGAGLLRPGSHRVSPEGSVSSGDTVLRQTTTDVLGRTQDVVLRQGGMKRLLESLPPQARAAFASVIEQTRTAQRLDLLDPASEGSTGMASLPVQLEGRPMTAFLQFDETGRITTVDASDEVSLQQQFEATDAGRPVRASTSASASGSSSAPVAPPLLPASGIEPRVDVSSQVRRTRIGEGRTAYGYHPQPDVDHGIWVQTSPTGELWLGLIAARPELSATLGSGTDMVLGLARALNQDGVGVNEIIGMWGQGEGLDSQHTVYREALASGQSVQQAAMSTFFGKVARMFGFTDVQVSDTPAGDFNVRFKRPSQGPAH